MQRNLPRCQSIPGSPQAGKLSTLLVLVLHLMFCGQVVAIKFNHLSTADGLKSPIIRSIAQSADGLIWMGAYKGLYRFDGYQLTPIMMPDGNPFNEVRSVVLGSDGTLWVASLQDGLFYLDDGLMQRYQPVETTVFGEFEFMFATERHLWVFFSERMIQLEQQRAVKEYPIPNISRVYSAINFDPERLLLGTQNELFLFNKSTAEFTAIEVESAVNNRRMHKLHRDQQGVIWLGRSDGLYQYDTACGCFVDRHDLVSGVEVYTIQSDDDSLWVGTTKSGLYQVNTTTGIIKHHVSDPKKSGGLTDNSIISLYNADNMLWLGTFNSGVNYINKKTLDFGLYSQDDFSDTCLPSPVIYDMYEHSETQLWLATAEGLAWVNLALGSCKTFKHDPNDDGSISSQLVYSLFNSGHELWITGSAGVDVIDLKTNEVSRLSTKLPETGSYFIFESAPSNFFIGTSNGLLEYQSESDEVTLLRSVNGEVLDHQFYLYHQLPNQQLLVGSTGGLFELHQAGLEKIPLMLPDGHQVMDITGLSEDPQGRLMVAADDRYLFSVDAQKNITDYSELIRAGDQQATVFEMLLDTNNVFWMSSDAGIFKIDLDHKTSHLFKQSDGLQSNDFLKISSHQGLSGKLYFGGRQGFNAFYPDDIKINQAPPKVILTQVSQLNKTLSIGQKTLGGLVLDKPINELESIELGYQDLSIGFEFAALDYADSARNQYAYRLLGFNDDWSYVGSNNRLANYTNLNPGNYTFQVKASNKDGVWNDQPKALVIDVLPAPWFSPWAYASYVLLVLLSLWAFIRYKTIASRKRAELLEVTVVERTQEVVLQKKMVESLLDHKNEVFANVTHEFKTPLALILGPVDEMANKPGMGEFSTQLSMVRRNAKRLLLMVGQILKLSQAEQDKEVIREAQELQPILLMLFESFSPLMKDKDIGFSLENNHDVNVYATSECLETVVGNLISNALKYTQKGGTVRIKSSIQNEQITIAVSDTGPGIKTHDLGKIFKRFTRLDNHKTIQGTGIGLSVVKEVTEANNGHINVESEWGVGSVFSVTFPITQLNVDGELSRVMTDQLVSNVATELMVAEQPTQPVSNKHAVTVLLIEDNLDMQKHTGNVLRDHFNCLFAARGEVGIAQALKEVPDIIICDVMMPGMDGYQVTRILRHDERTSHIPIILLTALNTKESRIKGWREKIDRYMTKPFDGTELIVQLESMLSIRRLLQEKTNQVIHDQGSLQTLELSKQDLKFIEKLQDVIAEFYSNEYFQKADLASKMAISERQLQRKVKALIGMGPLDMLRDYRLEQAKFKLNDGYRVGEVSSECGFSSVSYFGTCFKKKYGMTPKQYQLLD